MKKVLFIIIAILAALPSFAKKDAEVERLPFKYEVRLGWGGYPNTFIVGPFSSYDIEIPRYPSISTMYNGYCGPTYMTGAIAAEFSFHLKKWCSVGGVFSYTGIYADRYDKFTSEKISRENGASLLFMPQVRFSYLNKPSVKLYSSVGLGVGYSAFRTLSEAVPAMQLSLFGVSFGRKFFGFFELGIGYMYSGCMAGVGYRFN